MDATLRCNACNYTPALSPTAHNCAHRCSSCGFWSTRRTQNWSPHRATEHAQPTPSDTPARVMGCSHTAGGAQRAEASPGVASWGMAATLRSGGFSVRSARPSARAPDPPARAPAHPPVCPRMAAYPSARPPACLSTCRPSTFVVVYPPRCMPVGLPARGCCCASLCRPALCACMSVCHRPPARPTPTTTPTRPPQITGSIVA